MYFPWTVINYIFTAHNEGPGVTTNYKSSNRIEISQLGQGLFNF